MLKIFLVEDEVIVREGIKSKIDWEENGYIFCGEASDGELALPLIRREKPDIVITDIRMPFMDGLTLSRLIKEELPDTEIMILSGHEEFEYAKEGIKIGVAEYLLKPISSVKLLSAIDKVAAKITEKRQEQMILEQYRREMEENVKGDKRRFFQELVKGELSIQELLEKARTLRLDLVSTWYNIVLISVTAKNKEKEAYSKRLVQIEQDIISICEESDMLLFDRSIEGYAVILKAESKEQAQEKPKLFYARIEQALAKYERIQFFCGIGTPCNRISDLSGCFVSASKGFANRYFTDENGFAYGAEDGESDKSFLLSNVDPKQFERSRIQSFLKTGEAQEVVYFVEEFFKNLSDGAMESKLFRQYILMDAYFCITEFVTKLGADKSEIPVFDLEEQLISKESTRQYLQEMMEKAVLLRTSATSNRYQDVVDAVISYVEAHYAEDGLSLNEIAAHVNFSPNHLSMIFSQKKGETLIKFITDYRIQKAKEMLRCTNKKASLIALEVGYKDSHYFSYLFKKATGMTPTQYRS